MEFSLNIIEVVAATFVGMVLGAIWYSDKAFGVSWMESIGKTPETLGSPTVPMIGSIVASLLTAIAVCLLVSAVGVSTLLEALGLGLILGLGIVFPALLSDNLFCGWGTKLLMIQAGYRIVSILLMSVVAFYL